MKGILKFRSSFFSFSLSLCLVMVTFFTPASATINSSDIATSKQPVTADTGSRVTASSANKSSEVESPQASAIASSDSSDTTTSSAASPSSSKKIISDLKPSQAGAIPSDGFEKAQALANDIEASYGIKIVFSEKDINSYKPMGKKITAVESSSELDSMLASIKAELSHYPVGMFSEMSKYNFNLTIYAAKSVSGNSFVGLTDTANSADVKLTLINYNKLKATFNHELMHYIEMYIEIKNMLNDPFDNWDSLNPSGFVYSASNNSYTYSLSGSSAYFITKYSKSNKYEDKATIFSYMMLHNTSNAACLARCEHINAKAKYISNVIKQSFACILDNASVYWDEQL